MDEGNSPKRHKDSFGETATKDITTNIDVINLSSQLTSMEILSETKRKNNKRVRFTIPVKIESNGLLHKVLLKRRKSARLAMKRRRALFSKKIISKKADSCEGDTMDEDDDNKAGPSTETVGVLTEERTCLSGGDESTVNTMKRWKLDYEGSTVHLPSDRNDNSSILSEDAVGRNKRDHADAYVTIKKSLKANEPFLTTVCKQRENKTEARKHALEPNAFCIKADDGNNESRHTPGRNISHLCKTESRQGHTLGKRLLSSKINNQGHREIIFKNDTTTAQNIPLKVNEIRATECNKRQIRKRKGNYNAAKSTKNGMVQLDVQKSIHRTNRAKEVILMKNTKTKLKNTNKTKQSLKMVHGNKHKTNKKSASKTLEKCKFIQTVFDKSPTTKNEPNSSEKEIVTLYVTILRLPQTD